MSTVTGRTKTKSTIISALRRLRFTNFRPLFTSKVLAKPPLWRRSRKLSHYINNISNFRKLAYASAAALLLLVIGIVAPIYLVPENSEAATAYNPSTTSINITTGRGTSGVELDVASNTGSFATNYNTASAAEFSVTTDNATGYDLSITADNGVNLTRSGGSETLTPITTSGITSDDFNTTTYNNMWGYLPSYYNSVVNNGDDAKYYPITTSNTTIEHTDSTKLSGTYTIALGVRADYSKPAGTYTNTIKLTAVGNPASYNIIYDKNTTDNVGNFPSSQAGSTSATYITLNNGASTTPTRTGYNFIGWCDGTTTTTNGVDSCTGTTYAKNANFYFNATTFNTTTLHAMWSIQTFTCAKQYRQENADGTWGSWQSDGSVMVNYGGTCAYSKTMTDYKGSADGVNDEEVSATPAANVTSDQTLQISFYRNTYTLTINRNSTYISSASATTAAVHGTNYYRWGQAISITATPASNSKFTSWSQTGGTTGTFASTTSQNTSFTILKGDATIYANGESSVWGNIQNFAKADCSSLASSTDIKVTDSRDGQIYTVRYINGNCWMTRNLAIGCNGSGSSYGSSYASKTLTSTSSNASNFTTPTTGMPYSDFVTPRMTCNATYGAWYNFCAAGANTNNACSSTAAYSGSNDICPRGWRLPTMGESSGITNNGSAFSPITGGVRYANSLDVPGEGYWWTATAYSDPAAQYLLYVIGNYTMGVGVRNGKFIGTYVRCVRSS